MIRAANYLSVTVMDRIDQLSLCSVQVGSDGELRLLQPGQERAEAGDEQLKAETQGRKSVDFNPIP